MLESVLEIRGKKIPFLSVSTLVVGSGAAGLNAAHELTMGGEDCLLVTDRLGAGTSLNAGSDKQTYYKLSLSGDPDSVDELAGTYFAGGGMHGDHARVLAALSVRSFMKLVQLGVPFPHDRWGQYVGYKTDHDPRTRATSAGPLTSRYMGEALLRACRKENVPIREGLTLAAVLTEDEAPQTVAGVLLLNEKDEPVIAAAGHIVMCVGGAAGAYRDSVYPLAQKGGLGHALRAGASGNNMMCWQFGLGSVKVRWNLSGSYQQVIPDYYSTDGEGNDRRDFLAETFPDYRDRCRSVFLKGYQWPFDPAKTGKGGSSRVDLAVAREKARGRRVFMDFRGNLSGQPFEMGSLDPETREYLERSGCTQDTPFERLLHMNPRAVEFYKSHGIDLSREPLEIAVNAQHINGGLDVDARWRTSLKNLYAAGENAGVFGRYRPGGSALNETQCGSLRAAQHILHGEKGKPKSAEELFRSAGKCLAEELERYTAPAGEIEPSELLAETRAAMSESALCLPDAEKLQRLAERLAEIENEAARKGALGGTPRERAEILEVLAVQRAATASFMAAEHADPVGEALKVTKNEAGEYITEAVKVRPIPEDDLWFENVWRDFDHGDVFE